MGGFYNIEQNLPNFNVSNPLLSIQNDIRKLKLVNGGIFNVEPTKEIIMYNAAYRSNAVFGVLGANNTGTQAQLLDAFQGLNSNLSTNITSLGAISSLYGLRDVYISTFKNNSIFAINSAILTGKITSVTGTAAVLNGIRQNPVTVSTEFQTFIDQLNNIFDAVAARNYVLATAYRAAFFNNQLTRFALVIQQFSNVYSSIAGVGFTEYTPYFLQLLGAFILTPPTNSGDIQAIVDLLKQIL